MVYSELLGNALRGVLAEFIVASTIDGIGPNPREDWDTLGFRNLKNKFKIEIKSSYILKIGDQKDYPKLSLGIQPTGNPQSTPSERNRNQIFIYFLYYRTKITTVNPLNLNQWDFYILETKVLNEKVKTQNYNIIKFIETKST